MRPIVRNADSPILGDLLMRTLRQSLLGRDLAFLEVIARHWGLILDSRRKGEVIDQLEVAMLQPTALGTILADHTQLETAALNALLSAEGRMPLESFVRDHGSVRPVGPGRLRREESWRQPSSGAENLWYQGLIAFGFDLESPEVELVYIPTDLLPLLPYPSEEKLHSTVAIASSPERQINGEAAFRHDMCTFLIYLYAVVVRPGPRGTLTQTHRSRLLNTLLVRDSDRLELIDHLVRQLGFVEERDHQLKLDSPKVRTWLRASTAQQLRTLQKGWCDSFEWNELWHIPSLHCLPTGWKNDPLTSRHRFLDWLAHCPNENWLSVESLIQTLKSTDSDFLRPDGDYDNWYIRDVASGKYLTGFESWESVEGMLIRDLITRPLFWLGIVELGVDEEVPVSFRITSQGAAFLANDKPVESESNLPMEVSADLTVRVPLEGSLYNRFQVARFSESSPNPSEGDTPVFTYRITPESLARARKQQITLPQILAFLEQATGGNLPDEMPVLLTDWEYKTGKITIHRAVVLETTDDQILQELEHRPQTRRCLQKILGPRAALVAESDWPHLEQELRKLGYLATVEGLGRRHTSASS